MKQILLIVTLFCSFFNFAQDKTQELDNIVVYRSIVKNLSKQTLARKEIELIEPQDLGHLLQRQTGLAIKDYGGIGSFKSISVRGLGAQHTNFYRNGLPIGAVQSGITNLGAIQVENIENVKIAIGGKYSLHLPISSLVGGNSVALKTFENSFTPQLFNLYLTNTVGSFGQFETAFGYKKGGKNYLSISAKQRQFKGSFPFEITKDFGNGAIFELEDIRSNNQLSEYHVNIGAGIVLDKKFSESKHKFYTALEFSGEFRDAKNQLPGAVIFYGLGGDENLKTNLGSLGISSTIVAGRLLVKSFSKFQYDFLEYNDPDYFAIGGLRNAYTSFSSLSGLNASRQFTKFRLYGGIEFDYFQLQSLKFSGNPERLVLNEALGINFRIRKINIDAYVASYFTRNSDGTSNERIKHGNFSPKITLGREIRFWESKIEIWAKQSWRQASFNELFYSQIGSPNLSPEKAQQVSLNYSFNPFNRKLKIGMAGYYNLISDKIQTLPTKNLFVWSVQNLGEVEIIGAEMNLEQSKKFNQKFALETTFAYTFQQARDKTDPLSQTFNNQLAYTPEHTINGSVATKFYSFTFFTDLNYQSDRFSSNQNSTLTLLEDMYSVDISLGYVWNLSFKNKIKVKGGVRNLTNEQNQFVPFYPLPGRSFYLKLTYEVR